MKRGSHIPYVDHCLRFYAKNRNPSFISEIEEANWNACKTALSHYSKDVKELVLAVYRLNSMSMSIGDCICIVSNKKDLPHRSIWNVIDDVRDEVAKARGLI